MALTQIPNSQILDGTIKNSDISDSAGISVSKLSGYASTIVGQKASGGVVNLTPTEAKEILGISTEVSKIWKYGIVEDWWFSGTTSVLPFDGDVNNSIRVYSNTDYLTVPGANGIFEISETGYYVINSAMLISPTSTDTLANLNMTVFYLKVFKNSQEAGQLDLCRVSYRDSGGTGTIQWNINPYVSGIDTFYFEEGDLVSVNIEGTGTFSNALLFKETRLVISKVISLPNTNYSNQIVKSYSPNANDTVTMNMFDANIHSISMPTGNITLAVSNVNAGKIFVVEITQDNVGSRTITWFSTIKWAGGTAPTLTTTANKRDTFIFRAIDSNTYDGFIVGQNI